MINARIKQLDTGVRISLSGFYDYLPEDCTLCIDSTSVDFAEVLNTAVTNISTTATATPVKPNPFEERFIGRLLLFNNQHKMHFAGTAPTHFHLPSRVPCMHYNRSVTV